LPEASQTGSTARLYLHRRSPSVRRPSRRQSVFWIVIVVAFERKHGRCRPATEATIRRIHFRGKALAADCVLLRRSHPREARAGFSVSLRNRPPARAMEGPGAAKVPIRKAGHLQRRTLLEGHVRSHVPRTQEPKGRVPTANANENTQHLLRHYLSIASVPEFCHTLPMARADIHKRQRREDKQEC
jgi:hypothetical protein